MGIVVFWLEAPDRPALAAFPSTDLAGALQCAEAQRKAGHAHVCISSELAERVGGDGVTSVQHGRLPSGEAYDFSKAHRGAGPKPGSR